MNQLRITDEVYELLHNQLITLKHLCIIGGSKCGKSRVVERLIKYMGKRYGRVKEIPLDKISGVYKAFEYIFPGLDKPVFFLKNVSGLSLYYLEGLLNAGYLITTFPVLSPDLVYNRFVQADVDCNSIGNYEKRVWDQLPVIAENRKLGDGNVYMMSIYNTQYDKGTVNRHMVCNFLQKSGLYDGEYSRVSGKYVFDLGGQTV